MAALQESFGAPWGRSLKGMTAFGVLVLLGIAAFGMAAGPRDQMLWWVFMVAMPLLILSATALSIINGYGLTPETLYIRRPGWNASLDLSTLQSLEIDPGAMSKSIKVFGNGGLFCFAGWFHNKHLGNYQAFATDPRRAVVLRFPKRTVVITPDRPEEFVARVRAWRHWENLK